MAKMERGVWTGKGRSQIEEGNALRDFAQQTARLRRKRHRKAAANRVWKRRRTVDPRYFAEISGFATLTLPVAALGQRTAKDQSNPESNVQNAVTYNDRGIAKQHKGGSRRSDPSVR